MDLPVKVRLFRHLRGGNDPDAEEIYRWHISQRSGARMAAGLATDRWKRTTQDYLEAAVQLFESMDEKGYDTSWPVEVDRNGELLGGAHRLACAIALEIPHIPVVQYNDRDVWAPPWDFAWFIEAGMDTEGLERTVHDLIELMK